MLFLFIVIPQDCAPGIVLTSYGNSNPRIMSKANYSGSIRDIYFRFSFCPEESGLYDIFYNGNVDTKYESDYGLYTFNQTQQKSRVFRNLELREGVCYQVRASHPTYVGYAWGCFKYTHNGITRVFSSADSFTCYKGWCKNGGEFPQCLPPPTIEFTEQDTRLSKLFVFLLGLLLAQ